jgi:hypothetical protein
MYILAFGIRNSWCLSSESNFKFKFNKLTWTRSMSALRRTLETILLFFSLSRSLSLVSRCRWSHSARSVTHPTHINRWKLPYGEGSQVINWTLSEMKVKEFANAKAYPHIPSIKWTHTKAIAEKAKAILILPEGDERREKFEIQKR